MAGRPQQTRLALSRDARLELLARVDYLRAGLRARQWELLRRLCEALEESTDREGRASLATLATKCRCSERTIRRAADCGRRAGVILTVPTYDDQGRSANEWRVAWDRLAILAGWTSSGDGQVPDKKLSGTGRHRGNLAGTDDLFVSPSGKLLKPPPSHPNQASHREAIAVPSGDFPHRADGGRREDFLRLEQELYAAGVDRAGAALAAARDQGLALDDVAALVEHWRRHGGGSEFAAWGPGALCWRLQTARPQLPPDRGWPQPSPAFERHQRQRRELAAAQAAARERQLRARSAAATTAELPNAMDQLRELLRARNP